MNEKNDIMILDAVERYIRGEMNPDERLHFENLRKTNSEIDQLVVEHTLFLQQMNRFGEWQKFRTALNEVHTDLAEQGKINSDQLKGKAKVVYLWKRYRKVAAIAASIAGITAISISTLVWSISPQPSDDKLKMLDRKVLAQEVATNKIQKDLNNVKNNVEKKADAPAFVPKTAATGFLINGRGFMITNAHVVKKSEHIRVFNTKGEQFNAFVVRLDPVRDVAIIKIDDPQFKTAASLPYGISKNTSDIAEPVFTLGFPREEVVYVYGEGYMSANSGFKGDTLSCQITVPANPGNSGGPVFNRNGEVIGILSARETDAEGAVFAIQSKYIYKAIEELKKNKYYEGLKVSSKSTISGLDKVQQVKKIQDYIYMVKGD
ncbi:MAG: trypsin-like peptidase domain-containing protein [Bacteroidetes bacterium]|jgi:serine protease Do|nr:MAG: trypsin-like peptidase domain-containing protein [Bacteroidota bacterium]